MHGSRIVDLKFRIWIVVFDLRGDLAVDCAFCDICRDMDKPLFHIPNKTQANIPHCRAFNRICLKVESVGLIVISVQPYTCCQLQPRNSTTSLCLRRSVVPSVVCWRNPLQIQLSGDLCCAISRHSQPTSQIHPETYMLKPLFPITGGIGWPGVTAKGAMTGSIAEGMIILTDLPLR